MRESIPRSKKAATVESDLAEREKMAATIREKMRRGLTLTRREEIFVAEQKAENRRDDNPYQR